MLCRTRTTWTICCLRALQSWVIVSCSWLPPSSSSQLCSPSSWQVGHLSPEHTHLCTDCCVVCAELSLYTQSCFVHNSPLTTEYDQAALPCCCCCHQLIPSQFAWTAPRGTCNTSDAPLWLLAWAAPHLVFWMPWQQRVTHTERALRVRSDLQAWCLS